MRVGIKNKEKKAKKGKIVFLKKRLSRKKDGTKKQKTASRESNPV